MIMERNPLCQIAFLYSFKAQAYRAPLLLLQKSVKYEKQ